MRNKRDIGEKSVENKVRFNSEKFPNIFFYWQRSLKISLIGHLDFRGFYFYENFQIDNVPVGTLSI